MAKSLCPMTLGFFVDNVHPNDAGMAEYAQKLAAKMVSELGLQQTLT